MLFIVMHHFSVHGTAPVFTADLPLTANLLFTQLIGTGGRLGVDLFILISGWFLAERSMKVSSLARLWITLFLYSAGIYAVLCIANIVPFEWRDWRKAMLPVTGGQYWFINCYIFALVLSPVLFLAVRRLGKVRLLALLIVLAVSWSIVPTLTPFHKAPDYFYNPFFLLYSKRIWFLFLFMLAAFLRLHTEVTKIKTGTLIQGIASSFLFVFLWILAYNWLIRNGNSGDVSWYYVTDINSFPTLVAAICLFLLFQRMTFESKNLNRIAAFMLGVYLLHDNHHIRYWLWKHIVDNADHLDSEYYILWSLTVISIVFLACIAIDSVRQLLFGKITERLTQPLKKYDKKLEAFFCRT